MHLADQRNYVGGTILDAGERKEDYAERVCAQSQGMRGETDRDDSGDEGGNHGAEIGALKTKRRAILIQRESPHFSIYGQSCGQAYFTAKQKVL